MIICFTGTGNSLYSARLLAESLDMRESDITVLSGEMLLRPEATTLSCGRDEIVVWVFPTYSWGVPPVVSRFVSAVRMEGSLAHAVHHAMTTYGDDAARIDSMWRKLLLKRGCRPGGVYGVTMPNTYTLMKGFDTDSAEVAAAKLSRAPGRVEEMARRIKANPNGRWETYLERGRWAWLKSRVIYPWFVKYSMSPKPFHATDACVGCGLCSRTCPMDNIIMEERRPRWGDDCALCLRCYHVCPHHAVAYGKATQKKGQYVCPVKNPFGKSL